MPKMPEETQITKTCRKHGELKREDILTGIYNDKRYVKCRLCKNEQYRVYVAKKLEQEPTYIDKRKIAHRLYWQSKKQKSKKNGK